MSDAVHYRCSPHIRWVKETGHTLLVNHDTGQSWFLRDAEALIWDWLAVGHEYGDLVRLFALVLSIPAEEAQMLLLDTLQRWQAANIIDLIGDTGHG
jgi:hypothetical protein